MQESRRLPRSALIVKEVSAANLSGGEPLLSTTFEK